MDSSKHTYLITGITGMIGSLLTKALINSKEYKQGKIRIIGLLRDSSRLESALQDVISENFRCVECNFCDARFQYESMAETLAEIISRPLDYIIHCAAPTASSYMKTHPIETADSILYGTRNMLELARRFSPKSMVYLSSMEVYGQVRDTGMPRGEAELGDISLASARSCYPLGKRMAEHYCHIYWQEYGVPVKIARLAQTFGKGGRPGDNRVYMQFAKAIIENRDIVLQTKGNSMGNYCASEDAVAAVFIILEKGENGEVYNVVNEQNTMTIREMAELAVESAAAGNIQVKILGAASGEYAPDTQLRMSGRKLRELGWKPTKELAQMYQDVVNELQIERNKDA